MLLEANRKFGGVRRMWITRRELLKPALAAVCSFAGATFLLASPASALPPPPQEGANAETVQYDSGGISISAFLAKPSGGGKHPAVVLVHDNAGLTDGVREMARQFAAEGFLTLAPDLVSRAGASKNPQQAQGAIGQLNPLDTVQDVRAGFDYLQKDPDVEADKISAVGLGWGGWRTYMLASRVPDLYRAVVYCGATPNDGLENIKAPVMANYAQFDFRVTGNAIYTEKTMTGMGKKFTYYVYPNTERTFYNPTNPRYDADAAKQAWSRTIDFLR
jgi:carboxymethylenebutenolidase